MRHHRRETRWTSTKCYFLKLFLVAHQHSCSGHLILIGSYRLYVVVHVGAPFSYYGVSNFLDFCSVRKCLIAFMDSLALGPLMGSLPRYGYYVYEFLLSLFIITLFMFEQIELFHALTVYFHAHTGPIRSNTFHARTNCVVLRAIYLSPWSYRFSVDWVPHSHYFMVVQGLYDLLVFFFMSMQILNVIVSWAICLFPCSYRSYSF